LTNQVAHFDFIALADEAAEQAIGDLIDTAAGLLRLPGLEMAGVIRASAASSSHFDLGFFFVLDSFAALEPFGTHPDYTRFLQGKVAPILRAFAGADVVLDALFPEVEAYAACLALSAPEETYDWEVRAALDSWSSPPSAVGLAVGERQRYRGCVVRFSADEFVLPAPPNGRFVASLIAGHARRL
jgi:hypothetical protein